MFKYQSVLLVDDDPIQIAVLKGYFNSLGTKTIHQAGDAASALALLQSKKDSVDLIVSDLQMPNMDGLEFLRHLKIAQYFGRLAIISGVKHDLLDHAGRLASMHNLNFIGKISKPMTKVKLDDLFLAKPADFVTTPSKIDKVISQDEFSAALAGGEILPFYQPKFDVKTGRIVGAEALARWYRPGIGFISPEVFIRFAEQNGRIEDLTFSLFDNVLRDTQRFIVHNRDQKIAVNLAAELIKNISLPDKLLDQMRFAEIEPENISFEVTESSILNLDVSTLEVLSRLRISGFDVAIDDFGTGSSNIKTLRDFPYSELKIDRDFIKDVLTNAFSAETVRTSVALAREMGMVVVAEGIEDQETLEYIRSKGIEHAQGYHLSKPLSADNYCAVLAYCAENFQHLNSKNAA